MQRNTEIYAMQAMRDCEEERKRVAYRLHGDLAQSLAILSLDFNTVLKSINQDSKSTVERLRNLQAGITGVLENLLSLSRELWPAELDILGWEAACKGLVMKLSDQGIKAELVITGERRPISSEVALLLTRIIQETLRNVVKHAEASWVVVNVHFAAAPIRLSVTDNGKGFLLPDDMTGLVSQDKLGLFTIKERVRLSGGLMSIRSRPGEGTRIDAILRG